MTEKRLKHNTIFILKIYIFIVSCCANIHSSRDVKNKTSDNLHKALFYHM